MGIGCPQPRFEYHPAQGGQVHKRPLEAFEHDLALKRGRAFPIGAQNGRIALVLIQCPSQRLAAGQGIADALERAGADKSRGLTDQIGTTFAVKDSTCQARTADATGLGFDGTCQYLSRNDTALDQLSFLLFKRRAAAPWRERTAEHQLSVLEKDPGAALRSGMIKHARIVWVDLIGRKPLLNGNVFLDGMMVKQGSPNQGRSAVGSHDGASGDIFAPSIGMVDGEGKAAVPPLDAVTACLNDVNGGGDQAKEKAVKGRAIEIPICAAVVTDMRVIQIDDAHRGKLRIDKDIPGQGDTVTSQ